MSGISNISNKTLPITPKQKYFNDMNDGNMSEEDINNNVNARHRKRTSVVILFNNKYESEESDNDSILSIDIISNNENSPINNYINLNIIAHLSQINYIDAKAIWIQSCNNNMNNQYAFLYKLYPFLIKKFQF